MFYRHLQTIETSTCGFWKTLGTYWYLQQTIINNLRIVNPLTTRTKTLELYIVILFYTFATLDTLRMISIEAYRASIGRFYNRLKHCTNAQNVVSIRSGDVHIILLLLFFIVLFANTITCLFWIAYVGKNWCCLCKHSEIQAYWLLMPFSWVKLQRVQS